MVTSGFQSYADTNHSNLKSSTYKKKEKEIQVLKRSAYKKKRKSRSDDAVRRQDIPNRCLIKISVQAPSVMAKERTLYIERKNGLNAIP